MLNMKTNRPSLKKGKGVAKASAVSQGGGLPFPDVALRLGFKRGGKPAKPKFEFQEALKTANGVELRQRRGLMKTVAARVYNQMGLSIRTHEVSRAALLYFNQFRETLVNEDEREIADRLATRLGDLVEEFFRIRTEKIELAQEMELALTASKRDLRLAAAKKMADEESAQRQKGPESFWPEEDHPETAKPEVALDPALVLRQAKDEILAKEKAVKASKKTKNKEVSDDSEKETS